MFRKSVLEMPSEIRLEQNNFLHLVVNQEKSTQSNHKKNGNFLSHLLGFEKNNEVIKIQEPLQHLATSLQSNQALQASALVGRKVLVSSEQLFLGKEGRVIIAVDLDSNPGYLTACIYSESGEVVKQLELGIPKAVFFQFDWDGTNQQGQRLSSGLYKIVVLDTNKKRLKTMLVSNVDSVSLGKNGEGLKLKVAGMGTVSLNDISHIGL